MSGYNYRHLQYLYPYIPSQIEKVCWISDILARISQIPFLRERLSLYGGTALIFIHSSEIYRLAREAKAIREDTVRQIAACA